MRLVTVYAATMQPEMCAREDLAKDGTEQPQIKQHLTMVPCGGKSTRHVCLARGHSPASRMKEQAQPGAYTDAGYI